MNRVPVAAKINLSLLVGPRRADGRHEIVSVLQRIDICDRLLLREGPEIRVEGFAADTLVRGALTRLATEAGVEARWHVRLDKRIPVASGLGGGSADAAAALVVANQTLATPLPRERLVEIAETLGADVPFFLEPGPKLAEGGGERLTPLELPQDYWVVIALPRGARKSSTADVYRRFDERGDDAGFDERRTSLLGALARCRRPRDFAAFPGNDLRAALGPSPLLADLRAAGAFRADLSGAGPALYGLFHRHGDARRAARRLSPGARVWVTAPVW